jgi:hypothetical protein
MSEIWVGVVGKPASFCSISNKGLEEYLTLFTGRNRRSFTNDLVGKQNADIQVSRGNTTTEALPSSPRIQLCCVIGLCTKGIWGGIHAYNHRKHDTLQHSYQADSILTRRLAENCIPPYSLL